MRSTSPTLRLVGEHGRRRLDPELDRLAQELQAGVLLQRAGQQARLGEHLEAVADADDRAAGGGELARPRPSPARSGRSRRCAGSRRGRSRRARRPRRRRCTVRVAVPAAARPRRRAARPPTARRARSWCPGNARRRRARSRRGTSSAIVDRRSARSPGWRAAARHISSTCARAAPRRRRVDDEPDRLADRAPAPTFVYPSAGSARSTVAPCGSSDAGQVA